MSEPSINDLAAAAVAGDERLQARVRGLVNRMIDEAEDLIDTAAPQVKAMMIRTIVPALVKEMNSDGGDAAYEAMRQDLAELHAEIRSTLADPSPVLPPSSEEELLPDTPLGRALAAAASPNVKPPPLPRPDTRNKSSRDAERKIDQRLAKSDSNAVTSSTRKRVAERTAKKAAARKPTPRKSTVKKPAS